MTPLQIECLIVIAACTPTSLALLGIAAVAWLTQDGGHHVRLSQDGAHRQGAPVDLDMTQPEHVISYVAHGGTRAHRQAASGVAGTV